MIKNEHLHVMVYCWFVPFVLLDCFLLDHSVRCVLEYLCRTYYSSTLSGRWRSEFLALAHYKKKTTGTRFHWTNRHFRLKKKNGKENGIWTAPNNFLSAQHRFQLFFRVPYWLWTGLCVLIFWRVRVEMKTINYRLIANISEKSILNERTWTRALSHNARARTLNALLQTRW